MNSSKTALNFEPARHWINGEWIFGLAAAVLEDANRAQRVAHAIQAGTVWINTWGLVNDAFEEGGFKYTGIGRARGRAANRLG